MSTMQPFLRVQGGHTEKATNLSVTLFDAGEIVDVTRWQKIEQEAEGSIKLARFRAAAQSVPTGDSPIKHALYLTPSWPFFVDCTSDKEQERLFAELSDGGEVLTPLGDCDSTRTSNRIADRLGAPWPFNVA